MNILIIGNCGVGKTYVMQQIIEHFTCNQNKNVDQLHYVTNQTQELYKNLHNKPSTNVINIAGKYDGSTFQGSDRLSMSVMTSVPAFLNKTQGINIFEGDRFTNSKFITLARPFIIKILGNGKAGRLLRGSNQTERQIKSISTRVSNITADAELDNSTVTETLLLDILSRPDSGLALEQLRDVYKPAQSSLF